ncbi:MAG: transketolase C-terminal domain-containing protein, partial [Patescibacteria group bacterium]
TRDKAPVIYKNAEEFKIGGSKILKESDEDKAVIFTAGITIHEALKAYAELKKEGIDVAVVDLYSVKPLDEKTIKGMTEKIKNVVVVEDHYPAGGLGEAVMTVLTEVNVRLKHLCVKKLPKSGQPEELLRYEEIDSEAIISTVKNLI